MSSNCLRKCDQLNSACLPTVSVSVTNGNSACLPTVSESVTNGNSACLPTISESVTNGNSACLPTVSVSVTNGNSACLPTVSAVLEVRLHLQDHSEGDRQLVYLLRGLIEHAQAVLEVRLHLQDHSEGDRQLVYLLRGLIEWCIYPPQPPHHKRGRKELMSLSCTEETLMKMVALRDPTDQGLESHLALRLLLRLLSWEPASRPTARQALNHAFFTSPLGANSKAVQCAPYDGDQMLHVGFQATAVTILPMGVIPKETDSEGGKPDPADTALIHCKKPQKEHKRCMDVNDSMIGGAAEVRLGSSQEGDAAAAEFLQYRLDAPRGFM
eukprot:gene15892-22024_t